MVKPIRYGRFVKAVSRAQGLISKREEANDTHIFSSSGSFENTDNFIFVKAEYENIKIKIDSIKYVQGLKDYLKIHPKLFESGRNTPLPPSWARVLGLALAVGECFQIVPQTASAVGVGCYVFCKG